ncbi:hypothetical protein [Pseudonocardia sediminis]|uniref:hypothetical protein n=1 Tax=Pseudonocardia sediminis TaxID=1397368 RepID=UPI001028A75D|nr:hypothetical protein [Pseudonocardia sediminis]
MGRGDRRLADGRVAGTVQLGQQHRGDGHRRVHRHRLLPTLAQFQAYAADGRIHYFVSGGGQGGGGQGGEDGVGSQITAWVQAHYTATTVGGQTVYDLTRPTS